MRARSRGRVGFTLIELLVVISVILLLAALALPVLARATRSARAAQCVGNLKQIAACISLYCGDYDGMLPVTAAYYSPAREWMTPANWLQKAIRVLDDCPRASTLFPYYKDPELVRCPSDNEGNGLFSYSIPLFLTYLMPEQAQNTSESLLLIDEHELYCMSLRASHISIEGGFGGPDRPSDRHGRRTPAGFMDGQARLVEFALDFTAYDVIIEPWGRNLGYPTRQ